MSSNVASYHHRVYQAVPAVQVWSDTAQTITDSTLTVVTFNQENYDRWGMHSTSSNTNRLTVQVPGIYVVMASVEFDANATGFRRVFLRHIDSGGTTRTAIADQKIPATSSGVANMTVVGQSLVALPGEWFDCVVFQTSGGNLNLSAGTAAANKNQSFSAHWIGIA